MLELMFSLGVVSDSTPNRTMVLIRFREAADAAEFKVMYNGKPYHDTKEVRLFHSSSRGLYPLNAPHAERSLPRGLNLLHQAQVVRDTSFHLPLLSRTRTHSKERR